MKVGAFTGKLITYIIGNLLWTNILYLMYVSGNTQEFNEQIKKIEDGSFFENMQADPSFVALSFAPFLLIFYAGLSAITLARKRNILTMGLAIFPLFMMFVAWAVIFLAAIPEFKEHSTLLGLAFCFVYAFLFALFLTFMQMNIVTGNKIFSWILLVLNTAGLFTAQYVFWIILDRFFAGIIDSTDLIVRFMPTIFPLMHLPFVVPWLILLNLKVRNVTRPSGFPDSQ